MKSSRTPFDGCRTSGQGVMRRDFLRMLTGGALMGAGISALDLPAFGGMVESPDFDKLVPSDKRLDPAWVRSLFARGTPEVYQGADLAYIGMPVGGLCAGQLYLGGDGKLWHWDIFNNIYNSGCDGTHYMTPIKPESPLDQGFTIDIMSQGTVTSHSLDAHGFKQVTFLGEYPIGNVSYADPAVPVTVELEAFSPFIPLNWKDSSLPATVLRYTVKNTSSLPVQATLTGTLQNGAGLYTARSFAVEQVNTIEAESGFTFLNCAVKAVPPSAADTQVFEDWKAADYTGWTVEGEAFGPGPKSKADMPSYMGDVGDAITRLVSSHASAPGLEISEKDDAKGRLISRNFVIDKNFLQFWIGGGNNPGETCLNLIVDGKVVRTATGKNSNIMEMQSFEVRDLRGRTAHIEIVDAKAGSWGNILVGPIILSNVKPAPPNLGKQFDYGTMGLALLGARADVASPEVLLRDGHSPVGILGRTLHLAPGASAEVDFVLTWFFPHLNLPPFPNPVDRSYGNDFDSALSVANYVVKNFPRLTAQTQLWHDTWYDSTLPYWFLDRTFLTAATLATQTVYRFADGRFYGWEGVGSCPGTCTHVYLYAQAVARLFPELERSAREMADYEPKAGFIEENGSIGYRGEFDRSWAADGMAGSIIRVYRENEMSPDTAFLKRLWPKVKESIEFLMSRDTDGDGLLDGPQHNTLDSDWYGRNAWLSGMYAAALRAGEEMAKEVGDNEFAEQCHTKFLRSQASLATLFNGEYYINKVDPAHMDAINSGTGCEIDQVLGQSLAWQVGLGRIFPEKETKQALESIWRYNFTPDAGAYREQYKPGRWYAGKGEAGLLMCTFPTPDWDFKKASGNGERSFAGYFDECMNGFEYQAAGHMIAEGMVTEGLAVTRAVHDRYNPAKRNPWNEIECGDHYARSMASYGVFLSACGYKYHGPKGYLGFAPKLTPADFRAAFTAAEGWGTYFQKQQGKIFNAGILLRYGTLKLQTLSLELPAGGATAAPQVTLGGSHIVTTFTRTGNQLEIQFGSGIRITAGSELAVTVQEV